MTANMDCQDGNVSDNRFLTVPTSIGGNWYY